MSDRYGSGDAPLNVALADNGGVVTTSSRYNEAAYFVNNVNNGDRAGAYNSFWQDSSWSTQPDWVQIDFAGTQTINEVDVFSVQDNYTTPVAPATTMTFTKYGITAFDVQYWDGANWQTAASVTGNNLIWSKVTFPAVSTGKIRVMVNAIPTNAGYSKIAEIEAYTTAATPVNVALAANGGVASASSVFSNIQNMPATINNGDRIGSSNNYWQDNSSGAYPDWAQIDFNGDKGINEIDVYTAQNTWTGVVPTDTMTTGTGIKDFDVQTWDGTQWVTVPGGGITGNNKVWRKITFPTIITRKIRVLVKAVNSSAGGYSRIAEIEAYTPVGGEHYPSLTRA